LAPSRCKGESTTPCDFSNLLGPLLGHADAKLHADGVDMKIYETKKRGIMDSLQSPAGIAGNP